MQFSVLFFFSFWLCNHSVEGLGFSGPADSSIVYFDHVCRLDHIDVTADGRGTARVLDNIPTTIACRNMCEMIKDCKAIEYKPGAKRCEMWTMPVGHVSPKEGYMCITRSGGTSASQITNLVSGDTSDKQGVAVYFDHVCRADSNDFSVNGHGTAHKLQSVGSAIDCRNQCEGIVSCTGSEYQVHTGYCELWTMPIGLAVPEYGFMCMKKAKITAELNPAAAQLSGRSISAPAWVRAEEYSGKEDAKGSKPDDTRKQRLGRRLRTRRKPQRGTPLQAPRGVAQLNSDSYLAEKERHMAERERALAARERIVSERERERRLADQEAALAARERALVGDHWADEQAAARVGQQRSADEQSEEPIEVEEVVDSVEPMRFNAIQSGVSKGNISLDRLGLNVQTTTDPNEEPTLKRRKRHFWNFFRKPRTFHDEKSRSPISEELTEDSLLEPEEEDSMASLVPAERESVVNFMHGKPSRPRHRHGHGPRVLGHPEWPDWRANPYHLKPTENPTKFVPDPQGLAQEDKGRRALYPGPDVGKPGAIDQVKHLTVAGSFLGPNYTGRVYWQSAGSNTVCRLDSNDPTIDGRGTVKLLPNITSLEECQQHCEEYVLCKGIEYIKRYVDGRRLLGRCELWTQPIGDNATFLPRGVKAVCMTMQREQDRGPPTVDMLAISADKNKDTSKWLRFLERWKGYGDDRACRLDKSDGTFNGKGTTIATNASALSTCKLRCEQYVMCKGIEYTKVKFSPKRDTGRCEMWTQPIGTTVGAMGRTCLSLSRRSRPAMGAHDAHPTMGDTSQYSAPHHNKAGKATLMRANLEARVAAHLYQRS